MVIPRRYQCKEKINKAKDEQCRNGIEVVDAYKEKRKGFRRGIEHEGPHIAVVSFLGLEMLERAINSNDNILGNVE